MIAGHGNDSAPEAGPAEFPDTPKPIAPTEAAAEEFELLYLLEGTPETMRAEIARLAALLDRVAGAAKADKRAGLRHLSITRRRPPAPGSGATGGPRATRDAAPAADSDSDAAREAAETRQFLKRLRRQDKRDVPLSLRFQVLQRDRFRCTSCGANPATDPGCRLHVDHVVAFSKGGKTALKNLRTLCAACNLGKGARTEDKPGPGGYARRG